MSQIAVLGLGAMGSRIALNLLEAGHNVILWNRSPHRAVAFAPQGATVAPSPKAAAQEAEIVISMVTDNEASQSVWLDPETGAALGLAPGAIAIESSTLTVGWLKHLAAEIERRGAGFLEAPVVGSRPQAEAKKLISLVGGKADILAQVQEILLAAGSSTIHHVGEVGQGMAMKLAVNALFGIQVAALAEMIGFLTQNGVPATKAMECLSALPILSPAAQGAGHLMLGTNHAPLFPIELVAKDFRYVLETAQAATATAPTSTAVYRIYQDAIAQGYGNDNITGIIQRFT
ncbi:NAD(P)-dependent oxidoreductase [filamentous cyanobacterium CCP2]|nr:NAD(P)-dependent oxidoreductase [filamentous cyanobacterium CCP2]